MIINPERKVQETVLDFLRRRYKQTRWPYTKLIDIYHNFEKEDARRQLNELFKAKLITKRDGSSGVLIELNTKAK